MLRYCSSLHACIHTYTHAHAYTHLYIQPYVIICQPFVVSIGNVIISEFESQNELLICKSQNFYKSHLCVLNIVCKTSNK